MDTRRKFRRKEILFERQNGRCFWCNCAMLLLPKGGATKRHQSNKANLATIDHLRSRYNSSRQEPSKNKEERTVLACHKCNNERGDAETALLSIEDLRRRSGRYPDQHPEKASIKALEPKHLEPNTGGWKRIFYPKFRNDVLKQVYWPIFHSLPSFNHLGQDFLTWRIWEEICDAYLQYRASQPE